MYILQAIWNLGQRWDGAERAWRWLGRKTLWFRSRADTFVFIFGAIAAILAGVHSAEFPSSSAWAKGQVLPILQIGAVGLLLLTQFGVIVRNRRAERSTKLEDACRAVAADVDDACPSLPLRYVGVRIWIVSGVPWAKYLRRGGKFILSGERGSTGIRWTEGKGAVGSAWQKRRNVSRDLDPIRAKAQTEAAYDALSPEEQLGLSWAEFQSTPAYEAVFAFPLYNRAQTSGDPPVEGVMAIDLLTTGYFDDLEKATSRPEFEGDVGTCEDAVNA